MSEAADGYSDPGAPATAPTIRVGAARTCATQVGADDPGRDRRVPPTAPPSSPRFAVSLTTGELLLTDPEGRRSELDIVRTDGSHLWVGEATTAKKLANSGADELVWLERFKRVAHLLAAGGALLVTSNE